MVQVNVLAAVVVVLVSVALLFLIGMIVDTLVDFKLSEGISSWRSNRKSKKKAPTWIDILNGKSKSSTQHTNTVQPWVLNMAGPLASTRHIDMLRSCLFDSTGTLRTDLNNVLEYYVTCMQSTGATSVTIQNLHDERTRIADEMDKAAQDALTPDHSEALYAFAERLRNEI